jgi:D-arginine utilization repressor
MVSPADSFLVRRYVLIDQFIQIDYGRFMPKRPTLDLSAHAPLIEAVVALLHPHAEVVVHDVRWDRVAAIWNPFSGRRVGDPSLLGELPVHETGFRVLGPYGKLNPDGHRITSVTVEIANGDGLICINLDRAPLDQAIDALSRFAAAIEQRPSALFERDWQDEISRFIDDWCRQEFLDRSRLRKPQRTALIGELNAKGLFATRNAAGHVARALGVSRATVYSTLRETRVSEASR